MYKRHTTRPPAGRAPRPAPPPPPRFPAGRPRPPPAGRSLGVDLPPDSADASARAAARHGVTIAAGSTACVDGRHHHYIRLSFAEQLDTLELAMERLAAAWETHTQNLAASPAAIR